jgi:hypothetical protein
VIALDNARSAHHTRNRVLADTQQPTGHQRYETTVRRRSEAGLEQAQAASKRVG